MLHAYLRSYARCIRSHAALIRSYYAGCVYARMQPAYGIWLTVCNLRAGCITIVHASIGDSDVTRGRDEKAGPPRVTPSIGVICKHDWQFLQNSTRIVRQVFFPSVKSQSHRAIRISLQLLLTRLRRRNKLMRAGRLEEDDVLTHLEGY